MTTYDNITNKSNLFPGTRYHFSAALTRSHTTPGAPQLDRRAWFRATCTGSRLSHGGSPVVTIGFNTESWSTIAWMIWALWRLGTPKFEHSSKSFLHSNYTSWLRTGFSVFGIIVSPCKSPIYWLVQYPNKSSTNNRRIEMFWTLLKAFQVLDSVIIHSVDSYYRDRNT